MLSLPLTLTLASTLVKPSSSGLSNGSLSTHQPTKRPSPRLMLLLATSSVSDAFRGNRWQSSLLLTATDKPHAARELMFQLPSELLQIAVASKDEDDDLQSLEYTHYSSLFQCLEKHTRWAEVWARKPRPRCVSLE